MLPTPVSWPGEFHGLYSPWGHKESDTTELLSLSLFSGQKGDVRVVRGQCSFWTTLFFWGKISENTRAGLSPEVTQGGPSYSLDGRWP